MRQGILAFGPRAVLPENPNVGAAIISGPYFWVSKTARWCGISMDNIPPTCALHMPCVRFLQLL